MTLGQVVKSARKRKGWTQERLGKEVNLGQATISALENDDLGSRLDPHILIEISEALEDPSIVVRHCDSCKIRVHLLNECFDVKEGDRRDLAIIGTQIRKELENACSTLDDLMADFSETLREDSPEEHEKLRKLFQSLSDAERCIRILSYQLLLNRLL